ncbi:MAG: tetratricopeptide repeat protein [Candidatus Rokubacteria bacterium]|nr:tetratricopeptide repeat protein [Candidatus Rokubacteria bacterium]
MKCRLLRVSALALTLLLPARPALAISEPDRLWLVAERAFADGLHPLARHVLERFVAQYPDDSRVPAGVLLLGRSRLLLGDAAAALEAFRRAQTLQPPPGRPLEARFWEAEALFRLKRFSEARARYDEIVRTDASSPLAPDALYGFAWTELETRRPEPAATAFRDFLVTWPEHPLAPSATFYLARLLAELKQFKDALPLLEGFPAKYPNDRLLPDARYLLGLTRVRTGDPRGGLRDLREFVAAYPTHPSAPAARQAITQTLAKYGERDELQERLQALLGETPATPEGLADAASLAGRLGRTRDQEGAWRRLLKEFPDHSLAQRAALDVALLAFKRKDWKEASTLAQAATRSDEDPVKAEAWLLAGESDLKLKRLAAAVKAVEAVGAIKEVETGVRYRALAGLGLAREQQQQWRAALAAYEAVAARSPDATLREWARERAAAVKGRAER